MAYERAYKSICPVCQKTIDAKYYEKDGEIWLKKTCDEHGDFKDFVHNNAKQYTWNQQFLRDGSGCQPRYGETDKGCPHDCGMCDEHINSPAICLIDVTNRCNLKCPICFANADAAGYLVEPPFEDIVKIMEHFRSLKPNPPITLQLSGGEPTVREDLPDIIRKGIELGFQHIMLTTNGIRLGQSKEYCQELADAGVNSVYLQFDGIEPETWIQTRGENLLPIKLKAIDNWAEAFGGGGGVTLVPTIAKGINDHEVPNILDFAIDNIDKVVAIVFQPVALTGRVEQDEVLKMRYTSSELQDAIDEHTGSCMHPWYPISAVSEFARLIDWFDDVETVEFSCNPNCGFANWLIVEEDTGKFEGLKDYIDIEEALKYSKNMWEKIREKGKEFNAGWFTRKWNKFKYLLKVRKFLVKKGHVYTLLKRLILSPSYETAESFMFGPNIMIGCMHFQDPWNIDTERVKRCIVHYGYIDPDDGHVKHVPFCTMNTLHRPEIESKLAIYKQQPVRQETEQTVTVPEQ